MSDARADIIGLSDYAYRRTRSRLDGLADDEYFWEPVSGCCTIRRADSGKFSPMTQTSGFERDGPATATAALERAHDFWQGLLRDLPAASWWAPMGPVAGPYAEADRASLVLHQLDEQIHHGAELGVLRDLYLHTHAEFARPEGDGPE